MLNCKKGSRYLSSLLNLRIDKIFSDLRDIQSNVNTEFKVRFTFIDVAKSVGIEPTLPRTARCWSRYRNNVPGEDILPKFYYNSSKEWSNYKFLRSNVRQKYLLYRYQLTYPLTLISYKTQQNFTNSLKLSLIQQLYSQSNIDEQKQKLRVDDKRLYGLTQPSDSFINALQMADLW